eukprot:COSAG02_NODE_2443_length_8852_cov_63.348795_8_plen_64_part_00
MTSTSSVSVGSISKGGLLCRDGVGIDGSDNDVSTGTVMRHRWGMAERLRAKAGALKDCFTSIG